MYSNGRGGGAATTALLGSAMTGSRNPTLAVTGTATLVIAAVAIAAMLVGTFLTRLAARRA